MAFEVIDRAITVLPEVFAVVALGKAFRLQKFGMDAHNQYFLIIGAVENADLAALGQVARGAPKKVMIELSAAGMFEAGDLTPLRINARHDMADRPVLAR